MRFFDHVPLKLVALACFVVGFAGAVIFPDAEREASAASPVPTRSAPLFEFSEVFRADVNDLCRRHTGWTAENRGFWEKASDEELLRLRASLSRLRLDGFAKVYPPSTRDRVSLRQIESALRDVESLADDAAHAGAESVIDQVYRDQVMADLETGLGALSRVAEDRGLTKCAIS